MTATTVRKVGVIGAGTMGIGGAHAFAVGGLPVVLVDSAEAALDLARAEIRKNARLYAVLDRRLAAVTPDAVLKRITFTTNLEELADAAFVVENVTGDCPMKPDLHRPHHPTSPPSS